MSFPVSTLIADCLASGKGERLTTRDVIGSGPRTIAGVLEKLEVKSKIEPVENLLDSSLTFDKHQLLFVSGMTSDLFAIQKITRNWKKNKENPVIIGGPAASEPVRVLRKSGADISVTGEGETTIHELFQTRLAKGLMPPFQELHRIRGIAYRIGSRVEINPFRPIQGKEVFRKFPPSTKRITDYSLFYAARVYVEILRGCSNFNRARIGPIGGACTFCETCTDGNLLDRYDCPKGIPPGCGYCSVPSLFGPPKSRPLNLILDEVSELFQKGVTRIVLSAPGFLDYGREFLVEPEPLTDPRTPEPNYEVLSQLLEKLTSLPKMREGNASIMIENIKAALVTDRAATLLGKYLGGTPVSVGFETGDPEHARLLGRPDTPSETLRAIKMLREVGLRPYVYFIHGLPGQTESTVDTTVRMIEKSAKLGASRIILYRFQSLPMSAFTDCPSGPPSAIDPESMRIYEAAKKVNQVQKEHMLGSVFKVVVAEQYERDIRYLVSYPLNHGPVVLIEGGKDLIKKVVPIEVTDIASERIVFGRIN
jgi:radical SAM superfamily enzyme YgiQ (UPF0313 family)